MQQMDELRRQNLHILASRPDDPVVTGLVNLIIELTKIIDSNATEFSAVVAQSEHRWNLYRSVLNHCVAAEKALMETRQELTQLDAEIEILKDDQVAGTLGSFGNLSVVPETQDS